MTESSVKVYFSTKYSDFSLITGNRDLSERKIKKLEGSIKGGTDILRYSPILVSKNKKNGKFVIMDGQHRYFICKKLKVPVHFIIAPDITLRQIADINSNTDKWKNDDFLNCYFDLGIKDYKKLKEFKTKYKLSITICAKLLHHGGITTEGGSSVNELFKSGLFIAKNEKSANEVGSIYFDYKPYCDRINPSFLIGAICKLEKKLYNHNYMIKQLKQSKKKIEARLNIKEYLMQLEEIYNYRSKIRKTIFK